MIDYRCHKFLSKTTVPTSHPRCNRELFTPLRSYTVGMAEQLFSGIENVIIGVHSHCPYKSVFRE